MNIDQSPSLSERLLAVAGAWLAAMAIALAAWAAHGVEGEARMQLSMAAMMAFGNGIALVALAQRTSRRFGRIALWSLLFGTLLFSGSLVGAHGFGLATAAAPFGGGLMIAAWLAYGVDALRR